MSVDSIYTEKIPGSEATSAKSALKIKTFKMQELIHVCRAILLPNYSLKKNQQIYLAPHKPKYQSCYASIQAMSHYSHKDNILHLDFMQYNIKK